MRRISLGSARGWHTALIVSIVLGFLAGCGGNAPATTGQEEDATPAAQAGAARGGYVSDALGTGYEGALPASSQLALGTFMLEGGANAVTASQARALLPLWQALQGSALRSETETNAVLKQIERTMTPEQLTEIAGMQLTGEDLANWARETGVDMGPPPEAMATFQAGGGPPGGQAGQMPSLSDEERAAMRATRQAGGGGFGQGGAGGPEGMANMSDEERASLRATAEASGMTFGGRVGGGRGQANALAGPLVELLTRRAAE
jgi:hypothetical protein